MPGKLQDTHPDREIRQAYLITEFRSKKYFREKVQVPGKHKFANPS
jgi:hypothetical protein